MLKYGKYHVIKMATHDSYRICIRYILREHKGYHSLKCIKDPCPYIHIKRSENGRKAIYDYMLKGNQRVCQRYFKYDTCKLEYQCPFLHVSNRPTSVIKPHDDSYNPKHIQPPNSIYMLNISKGRIDDVMKLQVTKERTKHFMKSIYTIDRNLTSILIKLINSIYNSFDESFSDRIYENKYPNAFRRLSKMKNDHNSIHLVAGRPGYKNTINRLICIIRDGLRIFKLMIDKSTAPYQAMEDMSEIDKKISSLAANIPRNDY